MVDIAFLPNPIGRERLLTTIRRDKCARHRATSGNRLTRLHKIKKKPTTYNAQG